MAGTPSAALEVITKTKPLDIRLEEVLLNNFLNITRKLAANHLHAKIIELAGNRVFMDYKIKSPIHILCQVVCKARSIPHDSF